MRHGVTLAVVLAVLASAGWAAGQGWGEAALGFAWQNTNGQVTSFANHFNLDDGPFVERLRLDLAPALDGVERCQLELAGFGGEPWQWGRLRVEWDREWSLRVDYSRRESVFASPSFDLGVRRDDWAITRWSGSLSYRGWQRAVVRLDLRQVARSGAVTFPFYGLGTQYVARRKLDERLEEVGVSIATRDLPVALVFEQDLARLARRNRADVANDGRAVEADPDVLASFVTPGEDRSRVPTSRLAATYRNSRLELVARGLYRRERLDADRNDEDLYALGGGAAQMGFVDRVVGAAELQSALGDVRVGVKLTDTVSVRLTGRHERSASDATLLGERLLRVVSGGSIQDIAFDAADDTWLERTDRSASVAVDWNPGVVGASLAYHDGSRTAAWRRGNEVAAREVTRDASGFSLLLAANPSPAVSAQLGWEEQDFARYVFRTDAEAVTRQWGRLLVRPADGLELALSGTRERADNPAAVAGLDAALDSWGLAASFTAENGTFASVAVELLELSSAVDISFFAPGPTAGLSEYHSDLATVTVRGGAPLAAHLKVSAFAMRVKDRGRSAPFSLDQVEARLELAELAPVDVALFGAVWKYRHAATGAEDYDVRRFGIVLQRKF